MIRSLTFHIGDFKTGTTAIQRFLTTPEAKHIGLWAPLPNCDALAHSVQDPSIAPLAFAELAQRLEDGHGHAVLSSEHFESVDPRGLRGLIDAYLPHYADRIGVVGYLRPHASSLLARYAESLKIGSFAGTLDAYCDWKPSFWRLRAARRFQKWREAFGGAFHLRLFDRAMFPGGDIRRDFAQSLSFCDAPDLGDARENTTVTVIDLAYLSALQSAIGPTANGSIAEMARRKIGQRIAEVMARGHSLGGPKLRLHASLGERLWHGYRADAAELDALYFENGPVIRDLLQSRDAAQSQSVPHMEERDWLGPSARQSARAWGEALGAQLRTEDGAMEVLTSFATPSFDATLDLKKYA